MRLLDLARLVDRREVPVEILLKLSSVTSPTRTIRHQRDCPVPTHPNNTGKEVLFGRGRYSQFNKHGALRTRRGIIASFIEKQISSVRGVQYDNRIPECIDIDDVA